jgi:hypothetical protein
LVDFLSTFFSVNSPADGNPESASRGALQADPPWTHLFTGTSGPIVAPPSADLATRRLETEKPRKSLQIND